MEPFAYVTAELSAILAELLATGWEPPFTFTTADGRGSFVGGSCGWNEAGEVEPFVAEEYLAGQERLQLPLALTFVSRDGHVRVWKIRAGARPVEVTQ